MVYLEASPNDTERQLTLAIRKRFPPLPTDFDLEESLAFLHDHPDLLPAGKLVLIVDQFEQWLHGNRITDDAALISALRHCDGTRLQTVLMVRDDFFVDIHRFMSALGTPIRQFLDQAVKDLSDDKDRSVAIHLALFADMFRRKERKDWTSEALTRLGGPTAVGRDFLEESFDSKTANPTHRVYRQAAIAVLRKLLPPPGADLKGARQRKTVLHEASGEWLKSRSFDELLGILVQDLHLVSPSAIDNEPTAGPASEPCFQLTHDYLIPSLRDWLTASDRATPRGRARLILEECTKEWQADPHPRRLPYYRVSR